MATKESLNICAQTRNLIEALGALNDAYAFFYDALEEEYEGKEAETVFEQEFQKPFDALKDVISVRIGKSIVLNMETNRENEITGI